MQRVKISSKTSDVRVSLKLPLVNENKDYRITVERFEVPSLESTNFNEHLFTVRRKMTAARTHMSVADAADVMTVFHGFAAAGFPQFEQASFVEYRPKNIQTVSNLVHDMNEFLRRICRAAGQYVTTLNVHANLHAAPTDMQQAVGTDWVFGELDDVKTPEAPEIERALYVGIRSDGRLNFNFSDTGNKLFVVEFTEAGKKLLGYTQRYLTPVATGEYDEEHPHMLNAPYNAGFTELGDIGGYSTFTGSADLYHTLRYRDEVVIRTSLPVNQQVHIHNSKSHYMHQLATYQLPETRPDMRWKGYQHTELAENFETVHKFEESVNTHNSFKIKGTKLQLFHIDLYLRKVLPDGTFSETPFPMDGVSYFTLQLVLSPF